MNQTLNTQTKPLKIAITIPTGRPNVTKVVNAFLCNAEHYGYDLSCFSVYLSIDTQYQNTSVGDFKLESELEQKVKKVDYITQQERLSLAQRLSDLGINHRIAKAIFSGRGYSKQRNSALYYALKDNNDFAICFDDDEAPYIPVRTISGKVEWHYPDFFTPHINALMSGTDITRGPYMGYQSPIPSDFEKNIPKEIRTKLGEALESGSDVITRDSFFNLISKIKYLPKREIRSSKRPFIIEHGPHGKHIYAGNMGINLNSVRNGRVPVFFTPPNARGEDTIFALQLRNLQVEEVPSYIFHDPFGMYPKILEDEPPEHLEGIPLNGNTENRFADALIGWLKYAPILIKMTSRNSQEMRDRTNEMLSKIREPTQKLALLLDCPKLNNCYGVLRRYFDSVERDYKDLVTVQREWKYKIVPKIKRQKEWVIA